MKQSRADDRKSLGIAESSTNSTSGNKIVTFSTEDHYYDSNEWYALSKNDKDKVPKACRNINLGKKSTNSVGQFDWGGGGIKNGHGEWKSKISTLEKKVRNQKRQLSVFITVDKPDSDDEESDGSEKEDGNRNHAALTCQVKFMRSKKALHRKP